ncbi:phosphoribosylglycinamide formyltransferase [Ochrovirga pacifica]|uniref:phosphoribosylglycinamide formyltransferase n=1 Tax=Ochrovirga pacifica TaxID=1042376 RepID=UPI0002559533|nr:phosphoribosylglycinamide formyltransferase [Ochrovirga pacifica]
MIKIAILASGSGSNAENIARYFESDKNIKISYILSNKKEAFVLERAKKMGIKSQVFSNQEMKQENSLLDLLKKEADFIVLAGFLLKVPENIIAAFPDKIINIHPALLPKYGGKGMYGMNVHNAVKKNQETETGITIHYVNENYDEGAIIFQAKTEVSSEDTPEDIAQKVHALEYEHFPRVIKEVITQE